MDMQYPICDDIMQKAGVGCQERHKGCNLASLRAHLLLSVAYFLFVSRMVSSMLFSICFFA